MGRHQPGTLCSSWRLQTQPCRSQGGVDIGPFKASFSAGLRLGRSKIRIKGPMGEDGNYVDQASEWYFDAGFAARSVAVVLEGVAGSQNVPDAFGTGFKASYIGEGVRVHLPVGAQSIFFGGYLINMRSDNSGNARFIGDSMMKRVSVGFEIGGHFSESWKLFERVEGQYTFGAHDDTGAGYEYSTLGVMLTTNFIVL
jgi:hypothetical protein